MKKIILLLLISLNLIAQEKAYKNIEFEFNSGIMNIDFSSLKKLNEEVLPPIKITDNFSPRLNYGLNLNMNLISKNGRENTIGIVYNFYSNGSRITYSDYSGEFHTDNIYTLVQYGLSFSPTIKINDNGFSIKPIIQGGLLNTTIRSTEYQRVFKIDTSFSSSFSQTSYFGEIGSKLNYSFSSFSFGIKLSYLKEFGEINFINGSKLQASSLKYGIYLGVRL